MSDEPFSFFTKIENLPNSVEPIYLSATTLTSVVASLVDLLIEQQIAATLWVKLPQRYSWLPEIRRYLEQVPVPSPVYLCHQNDIAHPQGFSPTSSRLIPVPLQTTAFEQIECFFIIRSSQCSGLILAQQSSSSLTKAACEFQFKVIFSFEPEIVKQVLLFLQPNLNAKSPDDLPTKLNASVPTKVNQLPLTHLFLKQLQKNETNRNSSLPYKFLEETLQQFSNPLTHMKTALRLLESKQLKPNQRQRYVEMLQRECDRQSSLITGLQSLIHFEETQSNSITSKSELADIIPSTVSTYQPLAQEKDIRLIYQVPANLPSVQCPPNWLKEIIVQLLRNSLNSLICPGQVKVSVIVQENWIELVIQDTGVGILRQDLAKIFESFYRKPITPGFEKGAGLGLTIVKTLVERCGGSIFVNSKPQQGTKVKVLLLIA